MFIKLISDLDWLVDRENILYLCPSTKSITSWPGRQTEIIIAEKNFKVMSCSIMLDRNMNIKRNINLQSFWCIIPAYIFWNPHLFYRFPQILASTMEPHFCSLCPENTYCTCTQLYTTLSTMINKFMQRNFHRFILTQVTVQFDMYYDEYVYIQYMLTNTSM